MTQSGHASKPSMSRLGGLARQYPSRDSWLRPTRCAAVKVKLEWQSPRQLGRLRCALCSDAALHLLLCCFWFSWSAIKTYPLAPGCRSICLRSSSGHGTATTICASSIFATRRWPISPPPSSCAGRPCCLRRAIIRSLRRKDAPDRGRACRGGSLRAAGRERRASARLRRDASGLARDPSVGISADRLRGDIVATRVLSEGGCGAAPAPSRCGALRHRPDILVPQRTVDASAGRGRGGPDAVPHGSRSPTYPGVFRR